MLCSNGFSNNNNYTNIEIDGLNLRIDNDTYENILQMLNQNNTIPNVSIYGDKRDVVLSKFNQIQAAYGRGCAYYCLSKAPITITPDNPLCRFKTIVYNKIPTFTDEMGIVGIAVGVCCAQMRTEINELILSLQRVFGNQMNLVVNIRQIFPLSESRCMVHLFVERRSELNGVSKSIIRANEVAKYLNAKQHELANLAIESVVPVTIPTSEQLKTYLENPPKTIKKEMWEQAIEDNPDDDTLIPLPIIQYGELNWRLKNQIKQFRIQTDALQKLKEVDIALIKQSQSKQSAQRESIRRKNDLLSRKLLQITVRLQISLMKCESRIIVDEQLQIRQHALLNSISSPIKLKKRLAALTENLKVLRLQPVQYDNYKLNSDLSHELKSYFTILQNSMEELFKFAKRDLATVDELAKRQQQVKLNR